MLPRAFIVGNEVLLFDCSLPYCSSPVLLPRAYSNVTHFPFLFKSLKPQAEVERESACSVKKYPKYFIAPSCMRRTEGRSLHKPYPYELVHSCSMHSCTISIHGAHFSMSFLFVCLTTSLSESHHRIQYTIHVVHRYIVQ